MIKNIYKKFTRITTNQVYFPEIDGIRFLAISVVILFHAYGYFLAKTQVHFADNLFHYGWINQVLLTGDKGVPLFFVLSGFILCMPFAQQYINKGRKVELKKYYLRRVTRLEPPYFIAMGGIFCLLVVMKLYAFRALFPSLLASLAYSHELIYHRAPLITVVAWSLEVEIQFYIIAPVLFRVLTLSKNIRRPLLILAALGFSVLQQLYPAGFENLYMNIQYFLVGILLADLYVSDFAAAFFKQKWIGYLGIILVAVILYLPTKMTPYFPYSMYATIFIPFVIAFLYYSIMKNDMLKRAFSYKFIPVIGGMCYSIYLVHYTIISLIGRFTMKVHFTNYYLPNLLLQLILLIIPVVLCSTVFYYYVERPFMSRKWMDMLLKKNKKVAEINPVAEIEKGS